MSQLLQDVSHQICWDLDRLAKELTLYNDEANIWKIDGAVNNTAGHLSLHLIGNLNHFIGHMMGNTDYERNRENEFGSSPIPVSDIVALVENTKSVVESTLKNMTSEKLKERFPLELFGFEMSHQYFIIRLAGHLTYHLGQISYHRRLLD